MTDTLIRSRPRPRRWGWLIVTCGIAVIWSLRSTLESLVDVPAKVESYRTAYLLGGITGVIVLVFVVMLGVHAVLFLRKSGQELVGRHTLFILGAAVTGGLPAIILTLLIAVSGPDAAKLEAIDQRLAARSAANAEEFQRQSEVLLGGDVLVPETLMSARGISQARTNIAAMRELFGGREAFVQGHLADLRAEITNADITPFSRGRALAALDRDEPIIFERTAQAEQKNQEILDEWEAALDLLAVRPRRWIAQNGEFSFYTDADLATFDAHMNRIQALVAEVTALAADIEALGRRPDRPSKTPG